MRRKKCEIHKILFKYVGYDTWDGIDKRTRRKIYLCPKCSGEVIHAIRHPLPLSINCRCTIP